MRLGENLCVLPQLKNEWLIGGVVILGLKGLHIKEKVNIVVLLIYLERDRSCFK